MPSFISRVEAAAIRLYVGSAIPSLPMAPKAFCMGTRKPRRVSIRSKILTDAWVGGCGVLGLAGWGRGQASPRCSCKAKVAADAWQKGVVDVGHTSLATHMSKRPTSYHVLPPPLHGVRPLVALFRAQLTLLRTANFTGQTVHVEPGAGKPFRNPLHIFPISTTSSASSELSPCRRFSFKASSRRPQCA